MEFYCKVIGTPEPQGSTKGFNRGGRVIITSANTKLRPWRNTMASNFSEHIGLSDKPVFSGPVEVSARFLMTRIASLPKTKEKPHTVKPDLDKLLRALCDALTEGQVLADDALVVAYGRIEKRYALVGEAPGVEVIVKEHKANTSDPEFGSIAWIEHHTGEEVARMNGDKPTPIGMSVKDKQLDLFEVAPGERIFSGKGPVPAREIISG